MNRWVTVVFTVFASTSEANTDSIKTNAQQLKGKSLQLHAYTHDAIRAYY